MKAYRSYLFRNKDPIVDQLRTIVQDAHDGRLNYKVLRQIEREGGPSAGAMAGWFFKTTKRPQNASAEACGRVCGMKRVWVKIK